MAEFLKRKIYHEKQEPGSMLCAQHALNNLLQGNYFTGPDLAALARDLDSLEQSVDDGNKGVSTNMDDTGFFSVQVLEEALRVWGLSLERWRSPQMREFQSKPHTQLGFILNLELHWFTLRRFGPAVTDPTVDPGLGHWFNLNSFLSEPEWVSKTYLGMVLQQAEAEGYSVFVVQQADQGRPLALARTEADDAAGTIPEITGSATRPMLSTARNISKAVAPGPSKSAFDLAGAGLEDEDFEFQAALQASLLQAPLQENTSTSSVQTNPTRTSNSANDWNFPSTSSVFGTRTGTTAAPSSAHLESLDSSARRAREELARFQREQEEALRETYEDEIALGDEEPAFGSASVARRRAAQPDEEEEEMLRRAIEASRQDTVLPPEPLGIRPTVAEEEEDDTFDDDTYMEIDDEEDEQAYLEKVLREKRDHEELLASAARTSASSYARVAGSLATGIVPRAPPHRARATYEGLGLTGISSRVPDAPPVIPPLVGITGSNASHLADARYYDDEDEMLQAALKASLEDQPVNFVVPEPAPKPIIPEARGATSTSTPVPSSSNQLPIASAESQPTAKPKEESEDDEEEESESEEEAPKPLTAEQLRAARLARFGG